MRHIRAVSSHSAQALAEAGIIAAIILTLLVAPALAAKGGGNAGGSKPVADRGTISLVLLESTDGLAHNGQQVTFAVATTATVRPFVALSCSVDGVWVYSATAGFFPDYPWSQNFTLSNDWFTGAGDCTARLYSNDGRKGSTLATMSFHVFP